jgi:2',3'-cyclic-nucleotide 2'-phosphodiesterase (5'-nucleotidase family)
MFKWSIVANLTSYLGYTATSLGNHELDDGVGDLVAFIDATNDVYPTLACNLDLSKEPELRERLRGSIIVEVGGRKIGIMGYVTPETKES